MLRAVITLNPKTELYAIVYPTSSTRPSPIVVARNSGGTPASGSYSRPFRRVDFSPVRMDSSYYPRRGDGGYF